MPTARPSIVALSTAALLLAAVTLATPQLAASSAQAADTGRPSGAGAPGGPVRPAPVQPTVGPATDPAHPGLPDDAPPALYAAAPSLPRATGWPARNDAFPITSGTGRLEDGAFYWTDYLYDDHGATSTNTGDPSVTAGSPSFGTYRYPAGQEYAADAADIFRTAVALRGDATYWRVDWTTLQRRTVPLAIWTFDRDASTATGASAWPGAAGVSSPGIDTALIVSSRGARLLDVASGRTLGRLPTTVTPASKSFVVKVPRTLLPVRGNWRIRVAAGLSNADGTALRQPPATTQAQTRLYNVGFRTWRHETPTNNFWNDRSQTRALDSGNVARFAVVVHWSRLAKRLTTAQRIHPGWNDRWYVSTISLGNGVKVAAASITDGTANYLGRVQPYAVYVPRGVTGRTRGVPLTFLLHSFTQNHNQYAATTPKLVAGACERRRSVCVTTLGRGPDGYYHAEAELDFFEVWHAVADTFRLDPDRTVLTGYSMGGIGTNQLAMAHPDLYARAITLAGAVGEQPYTKNLRWIPVYQAGGVADELVPVTLQRAEAEQLRSLGLRYRWAAISGVDHVAYELCDCFDDAIAYLAGARRTTRPDRFDYRWIPLGQERPAEDRDPTHRTVAWTEDPEHGLGTTGAYWLRNLKARNSGRDADISARSLALPARVVRPVPTTAVVARFDPAPATIGQQTWRLGAAPTRRPEIHLTLTNVGSLDLRSDLAGIRTGQPATLVVTTDGVTRIYVGRRVRTFAAGTHRVAFTG